MPSSSAEIEVGGQQLYVEFDYKPFVRGNTSGPPESCFPDEGGEVEVTKIEILTGHGTKTGGLEWLDITDLINQLGGNEEVDRVLNEYLDATDFFDNPSTGDDYDDRQD